MTATATTPGSQTDDRQLPGDGKRSPRNHIVRIVVVPKKELATLQHQGLTDQALTLAEALLKDLPAPPLATGTAGAPPGMFEALRPTDIVVVGSEPASVRVLDKKGQPVPLDESGQPALPASGSASTPPLRSDSPTRRLFAHDDGHKDTVLRVWTESATVEYQPSTPFEIVKVERAGWRIYGAPDDPFAAKDKRAPYKAVEMRAGSGKTLWTWKSDVVPASANNQQYKATFRIDGEEIDPDVVCGDPPPSP